MKTAHLIICKIIILSAFSIIFNISNAQSSPFSSGVSNNSSSRWYFGGNFGLSFGTVSSIYIAPKATYAITEKLYGGLGVSYQYYSDKRYIPKFDVSTYGLNIFARYFIFQDLFAHIEYEKVFYKDSYNNPGNSPYISADGYYAGGGYRQWIGSNSYMTIAVLFDLQSSQYEFGINPFIRIGMGFGI